MFSGKKSISISVGRVCVRKRSERGFFRMCILQPVKGTED